MARTEPGLATSYVDAGKVGVDLTDLAHGMLSIPIQIKPPAT